MPRQRKEDQAVDAFSAPKEFLRAAQLEAKRRGMSKSGFYRYCLAKEIGMDEGQALRVAEHASTGQFEVIAAPKPVAYRIPKKREKKPSGK